LAYPKKDTGWEDKEGGEEGRVDWTPSEIWSEVCVESVPVPSTLQTTRWVPYRIMVERKLISLYKVVKVVRNLASVFSVIIY